MVSLEANNIRDVINVTSEEVPDDKVLKRIKRAEVTLELEANKIVAYSNRSDAEKESITVLATVYTMYYLTGRSAVCLFFPWRPKRQRSQQGSAPRHSTN